MLIPDGFTLWRDVLANVTSLNLPFVSWVTAAALGERTQHLTPSTNYNYVPHPIQS